MSVLLAFTADQVCRLTGLSERQLRSWDQSHFFHPQFADEDRRQPYSRVYSFRDVVGLRTIAILRKKYGVSLGELRKVGDWLSKHHEAPWSNLRFYVGGHHVYFEDPEIHQRRAGSQPQQIAFPIEMEAIAEEMESAAEKLRERNPDDVGQIERLRYVHGGAPVLKGTRVPTAAIWSFYQAGYDPEAILREYPALTGEDIRAAISYEEGRRHERTG